MKFRTPYNYDVDVASFVSGLDCSNDPSRAQQHMKDETDINRLVKVFGATGIVPGADLPATEFAFDEVFDFQTAMNAVVAAERSFAQLPSHVRARFSNNPAEFLSFVDNIENRDEAIRLGLIQAPDLAGEPIVEPVSQEAESVK